MLEVISTAGSCGRVAGEARNMTENALPILIVSFFVPFEQTETSDRKLSNFQPGLNGDNTVTRATLS